MALRVVQRTLQTRSHRVIHKTKINVNRPLSTAAFQIADFKNNTHNNNINSKTKNSGKIVVGVAAAIGIALANSANSDKKKEPDYNAIRKVIVDAMESNPDYDDGSFGPVLVRLAWHAAGTYDKHTKTGGSNGATMRFHPEASHGANAGLGVARALLEPIKKAYPEISYADLWTFAGCVAIEEMGGPKIPWRPGRSDAVDAKPTPPEGRLPDAAKGQDHIRDIFYRMGFDDREIVALIGAHSIGRCHKDRSGFDGPWTRAPTTFSNEYFKLLLSEKWVPRKGPGPKQFENSSSGADLMMLPADLALTNDPSFRKYVEIYSKDQQIFFNDFAKAFGKLLDLGVPAAAPATTQPSKSLWQRIFG